MKNRVHILDIWIDNLSLEETLGEMERFITSRFAVQVITMNVDSMVKARRDPEFRAVIDRAPLVLADGMPLLWAAKFLGSPLKERVAGSDLAPLLCARAAQKGYRVFLVGGRTGSAEKAAENLKGMWPDLCIAGIECPPQDFEKDPETNKKVIERIRQAAPEILFAAFGAPRQEKWLDAHLAELRVPLSIGIGGVLEMIAEVRPRAPRFLRNAGFEWLWRLALEPRRLWRRYLVENPVFFRWVLAEKLRKRGHRQ